MIKFKGFFFYAIQDGYSDKTDAIEIWKSYFDKNIGSFGEEGDVNRIEMFSLNDFGSDWGQLNDVKSIKNEDGTYSNVYVFVYKGTATTVDGTTTYDYLLPGNKTTSPLFTSVTLNKDLGNPKTITTNAMAVEAFDVQSPLSATYNTDDEEVELVIYDTPMDLTVIWEYYIYGLRYGLDTEQEKIEEAIVKMHPLITEIEIEKSAKLGGTGTKITGSSKTTTIAEFTVIYYGDANGDGAVNQIDLTMLNQHINNTSSLTSIQQKAMDLNHDGQIDNTDSQLLQCVLKKVAVIDQESGKVTDPYTGEAYILPSD